MCGPRLLSKSVSCGTRTGLLQPHLFRDGPAGRGGRGFNRDKAGHGRRDFECDGRRPSPRDRSIRPDHRRRSFVPGVQCNACKRIGHEASSCDMLAIALFLDK